MLVTYLTLYFIFIIVVSIVISLLVLMLRLPAPKVLVPTIIAIIILPALLGYLFVSYFSSIPEVDIPDVRGMLLEEAEVKLGSLELKGRHAGSVYDTKYPEGSVISQRPEAGRRVKAGRIVNLIASSGKRMVIAPNLLGRYAEQAKVVLIAKGLLLGEIERDFVPELDPGIILVQNPLPGEEVKTGSLVNITISASKEPEGEGMEEDTEKDKGGFKLWW